MAKDDRCLFDRLDDLEAQVAKLSSRSKEQDNFNQSQHAQQSELSKREQVKLFLIKAKKSLLWLGNKKEFSAAKAVAIISFITTLVLGIASGITSALSLPKYGALATFTLAWIICTIVIFSNTVNTKRNYEVNELSNGSPFRYQTDEVGMKYVDGEKVVYKAFRVLAIIMIVLYTAMEWIEKNNLSGIVTILEILFLGSIIFQYIAVTNLFSQYSIVWVEGHNLFTKEKLVLVLPPFAKQMISEEEFREKMPQIFEGE